MNRVVLRYARTVMAAGTIVLIVGCQASQPAPKPVTGTPPQARQDRVTEPESVTLFGDHPDAPVQPENRLLTNMAQHTFSAVGRDFDPDLDETGNIMVFASTRNSEHPDIYMKHVNGYALTQLTSDPADDIQPRFSPDASSVVFASNRAGNWDIWLVKTDGTGLTQLTQDRGDEVAPCFSPDGKRVAFTAWGQRSRQWEIWVLAVDRPGVRRFLCYGMFPDWSPDGKRIAFQRARQRGTRWFSVWSVELVGDEARHPTELAYSDSSACIAPRWSPDGQTLAYCAVVPGSLGHNSAADMHADIWTVNARTGMRQKLTDGAVPAFNPTWSPSGQVYFVSAQGGAENVWSLRTTDSPAAQPVARTNQTPEASKLRRTRAASANVPVTAEGK